MRIALVLLLGALTDGKPVLVVKTASCFVHAVPACTDGTRLERVLEQGQMLLHTVRESGEMTVLVPPTGVVAVSTRRISYRTTRIAGVAADVERLYVLLWTGHAFDKPPGPEEGSYVLRTFWLEDGAAIPAPALKPEGLPKEIPAETLERGPLRLVEGGVELFGTRVGYKGRQTE